MPGGEESDRGAVGGSGGEASGGASLSRSSHSGTDRGSVGRGRAGAGVTRRCRWPWPDDGRVGGGHRAVPGASGDGGRAAGHTLALPWHRRRGGWQCRQSCHCANSAAASSPCAGECVPDSRPRGSAAPVAAGAAAPPTGALMAPPRVPRATGLHESRRRTERGSLAPGLYWRTSLWYNLNCKGGGGRICTPPES